MVPWNFKIVLHSARWKKNCGAFEDGTSFKISVPMNKGYVYGNSSSKPPFYRLEPLRQYPNLLNAYGDSQRSTSSMAKLAAEPSQCCLCGRTTSRRTHSLCHFSALDRFESSLAFRLSTRAFQSCCTTTIGGACDGASLRSCTTDEVGEGQLRSIPRGSDYT